MMTKPTVNEQARVFLDTLLKSTLWGLVTWLSERGYVVVDVRNGVMPNSEWLETMIGEYLGE